MREVLYDILSDANDVVIYNSQSLNWKTFTFSEGYILHKLELSDIYKPYLVSLKYYNSIDYEDIILILNNIEDIFEVVPGTEIKIPKLNELKNFIVANKK